MRKTYGNTWWGSHWLNALKEIDFSNRLPRGRTYANKGAVSRIEIDGRTIRAVVQGSRFHPYQVELHFSVFTKQQQKAILRAVSENPLLLSHLLNREMPQDLFKVCEAAGIDLFPRSWNDLQGRCSCPDWAVPCKHLAAVLYITANEIDHNPFLIFELHDFDLLQALEKTDLGVAEEKEISIISVDELMEPVCERKGKIIDGAKWQKIDFSVIPVLQKDLLHLLGNKPPFYNRGDFKKILSSVYARLHRQMRKRLEVIPPETIPVSAIAADQVEVLLDSDLDYLTTTVSNEGGESILHLDTVGELLNWLEKIPPHRYFELSEVVRGLVLSYQLAQQLIVNGAFIPQLICVGQKGYRMRWIPGMLNAEVKKVCEEVSSIVPDNILFYRKKKTFYQPIKEDTFLALINIFLSALIQSGHQLPIKQLLEKVPALFFQNTIHDFLDFSEQSYPATIQLWLNKFYLGEKKYVPIIQVEDAGEQGFAITLLVEDRKRTMQAPVALSEIFEGTNFQAMRLSILRDLAMLTEYFPQIGEVVAAKGRKVLLFDANAFVPVLFKLLPSVQLLGIKVLLPKALRKLARPKLSMSLNSEGSGQLSNKKKQLSLQKMLQFEWKVALGGQQVSIAEFKKMASQFSGIIRLNDEYVFFDETEIHQLINQLISPSEPTTQELIQVALTEEYKGAGVHLSEGARKLIKRLIKSPRVKVPRSLNATLRPYQQRGYEWLYKNTKLGFGSLLADDMGLGKTLQVITILLRLKEEDRLGEQKALIIVPTTLLTNWEKEIDRFAPLLNYHTYHGPKRSLSLLKEADLLITTYGVVRSETTKLQKKEWLAVIIDEAQQIKNPATAQTKAVKKIKAPIKIAMSGTPVENRLSEYWSVFDFTNQGYLGGLKTFVNKFAKPIEINRDHERIDQFRKITAPFIMRRLKSDKNIIQDLPDKIEKNQFCRLTKEQAALYQSVVSETMERIETAEGITRKGLILKLLTSLKQVCNHPRQFLKRGDALPEYSGKCLLLFDLLKDILANNGKALIFTQYQEMGKLLQDMIRITLGVTPPFLYGGISRKKRDQMVHDFQMNRTTKVMILSLKAAGTGLNLTAANHVIHYDLWWNPAVEAQATDRAFRIGQQRNVLVHRFITQDTFEEKIDKMLQSKKKLADLTVAHGEKWIGDLSTDELKELVRL